MRVNQDEQMRDFKIVFGDEPTDELGAIMWKSCFTGWQASALVEQEKRRVEIEGLQAAARPCISG